MLLDVLLVVALVVVAGVIFWVTREREEDQAVAEEAEKLQDARRKRRAISIDVDERKAKYIIQDFGLYRIFYI